MRLWRYELIRVVKESISKQSARGRETRARPRNHNGLTKRQTLAINLPHLNKRYKRLQTVQQALLFSVSSLYLPCILTVRWNKFPNVLVRHFILLYININDVSCRAAAAENVGMYLVRRGIGENRRSAGC